MIAIIISALPITIDKHVMLLQGCVVCSCEITISTTNSYCHKINNHMSWDHPVWIVNSTHVHDYPSILNVGWRLPVLNRVQDYMRKTMFVNQPANLCIIISCIILSHEIGCVLGGGGCGQFVPEVFQKSWHLWLYSSFFVNCPVVFSKPSLDILHGLLETYNS